MKNQSKVWLQPAKTIPRAQRPLVAILSKHLQRKLILKKVYCISLPPLWGDISLNFTCSLGFVWNGFLEKAAGLVEPTDLV